MTELDLRGISVTILINEYEPVMQRYQVVLAFENGMAVSCVQNAPGGRGVYGNFDDNTWEVGIAWHIPGERRHAAFNLITDAAAEYLLDLHDCIEGWQTPDELVELCKKIAVVPADKVAVSKTLKESWEVDTGELEG